MLEAYSKNRLVWPVALVFTFFAWIMNGWFGLGGKIPHTVVLSPFFDYLFGMVACAAAVYLIAELATRYSLLGNTDRTISLTMMLLVAMATFVHPLQKAQVVVVAYLIAYIMLLGAYQSKQAPLAAFSVNLALGVATLFCPQLVWLLIVNLVSFGILRELSLKVIVASLLGVSAPYWFWAGLSPWIDVEGGCSAHLALMTQFASGGLGIMPPKFRWSFWVALSMALVGGVDFFVNIHLNRSRMRMDYYVVCLHAASVFFFIWMEPQLFRFLFPLVMVNAAILFGHFTSFAKGRIPDILLSLILILWLIATLFVG